MAEFASREMRVALMRDSFVFLLRQSFIIDLIVVDETWLNKETKPTAGSCHKKKERKKTVRLKWNLSRRMTANEC